MKFLKSLRMPKFSAAFEEEPVDFDILIEREQERLLSLTIGWIDAEATGLDERVGVHVDDIAPRDLAELVAFSVILAGRFHYAPLERWAEVPGLEEARALFRATWDKGREGYLDLDDDRSWREHLTGFARALHVASLIDNPMGWLAEWRPDDPRLHEVKLTVLREADLGTLTDMLEALAQWEHAQYEGAQTAPSIPEPGQTELWQGLSDTRAMRHAVQRLWVRHPRLPPDYSEDLQDAPPEKVLEFLGARAAAIDAFCQQDEMARMGLLPDAGRARKEEGSFSLYQQGNGWEED